MTDKNKKKIKYNTINQAPKIIVLAYITSIRCFYTILDLY